MRDYNELNTLTGDEAAKAATEKRKPVAIEVDRSEIFKVMEALGITGDPAFRKAPSLNGVPLKEVKPAAPKRAKPAKKAAKKK